jgi:transaldolase/glucose-6-phosphate isomerase
VGFQAFVAPTPEVDRILTAARLAVRDSKALATTLDYGPRFLHSTGQLHKGGPNTGLFIEIIDHPAPELPVPATDYSFAELITAQSLGDYLALRRRDRRLILICLGDNGLEALRRVGDIVIEAARRSGPLAGAR